MEVLSVLEQKISSLVEKLHKYIEVNEQLRLQKEALQKEVGDLRAEVIQLTDENMQLTTKVQSFLDANSADNKKINDLCQEKEDAKRFVDDLIRSIESLVEQENQL
jgi:FtsZ-binding cell division protein ZapB